MRALGHRPAVRWLGEHVHAVGARSALDLAAFAGSVLDTGIGGWLSAAA